MWYNLTFNATGIGLIFDAGNSVIPLSSTVLLTIIPFIILFIAMLRFGASVSFSVSSLIIALMSVLFTAYGAIPEFIVTIFFALTILGFLWISLEGRVSYRQL